MLMLKNESYFIMQSHLSPHLKGGGILLAIVKTNLSTEKSWGDVTSVRFLFESYAQPKNTYEEVIIKSTQVYFYKKQMHCLFLKNI